MRSSARQHDPQPDSTILFNDQDVAREDVGRRQVGFVFQHYALFRHMTVFENIAFGLRVRRGPDRPSKAAIREKVHELLNLIQLEGVEINGNSAKLFVRPYDLDIHVRANGATALRARVLRIHAAGPLVRVELSSETGQEIQVEMPHDRFRQEPVAVGDHVFVSPRDLRVFVEDYSI